MSSFIPKQRPKSWVVSSCSCLISLAGGLIVVFLGDTIEVVGTVGAVVAVVGALAGIVSAVYYGYGLSTGRYKQVEPRPWKEQVW